MGLESQQRERVVEAQPCALVVDDEPDVLQSLGELLRDVPGLRVERASSIGAALAKLREREYDLIIADERLPDGSGVELLAWAGHQAPASVLVLMSAHDDFTMLQRGVNEARVQLFLQKPWQPDEVLRQVARLLDEQRAMQQRLRAYARALAAEPAPHEPVPGREAQWPPS